MLSIDMSFDNCKFETVGAIYIRVPYTHVSSDTTHVPGIEYVSVRTCQYAWYYTLISYWYVLICFAGYILFTMSLRLFMFPLFSFFLPRRSLLEPFF